MPDDYDPDWWRYENLESRAPYDWAPATRGDRKYDQLDFHCDLMCGTVPKGRLGIDRFPAPGVDLLIDLETGLPASTHTAHWGDKSAPLYDAKTVAMYRRAGLDRPALGAMAFRAGLPFPDNSIESLISHHGAEHLDRGFISLMNECHRILKPGGIFRIVVPLFPSHTAVADPDHKRYFLEGTFEAFCGTRDGKHWSESFSVPYTSCRFELVDEDVSPPTPLDQQWTRADAREMRVALRKWD